MKIVIITPPHAKTCMNFFLLWNMKGDSLKNVGNQTGLVINVGNQDILIKNVGNHMVLVKNVGN